MISFLINFKNKDFEQQQEFKKQQKEKSEKDKYEMRKKQAVARDKDCQKFQEIDHCSPDNEEQCKKCPYDWHKFL